MLELHVDVGSAQTVTVPVLVGFQSSHTGLLSEHGTPSAATGTSYLYYGNSMLAYKGWGLNRDPDGDGIGGGSDFKSWTLFPGVVGYRPGR